MSDPIPEVTTPEPDAQPMSFQGKIGFAQVYHQMVTGIQHLVSSNQDERARELFKSTIPHFRSLWDMTFIENVVDIQDRYPDIQTQHYLMVAEFEDLMHRCGVAPKPDVRSAHTPLWDEPVGLPITEEGDE